MTNTEKRKAEKKADVALCKLLDLYYITPKGCPSRIATRLDKAIDAVWDMITEIENTETKRR